MFEPHKVRLYADACWLYNTQTCVAEDRSVTNLRTIYHQHSITCSHDLYFYTFFVLTNTCIFPLRETKNEKNKQTNNKQTKERRKEQKYHHFLWQPILISHKHNKTHIFILWIDQTDRSFMVSQNLEAKSATFRHRKWIFALNRALNMLFDVNMQTNVQPQDAKLLLFSFCIYCSRWAHSKCLRKEKSDDLMTLFTFACIKLLLNENVWK